MSSTELLIDVHSDADGPLPFILLQPGTHLPRSGSSYNRICTYKDINWIVESASKSRVMAVDFETVGGDYTNGITIVGIGLAWDSGSVYLDWQSLYSSSRNILSSLLLQHTGLIAHNVYFDGGVLRKETGQHAQWLACTYSLLAHLANESPERKWGLKATQTELLGWPDSNEHELDEWLVTNGYYIGNERKDESPENLRNKFVEGSLRPDKGEMWRAPTEILGKYCILDAESCYLLYTRVLEPTLLQFPGLVAVFSDTMNLIQILIDQKITGIETDRNGLEARREKLLAEIAASTGEFISNPQTQGHIKEMELVMCQEISEKEPPKYKKDGGISKNWINWEKRLSDAISGRSSQYKFNINSGPQLRELLYTRLQFEVRSYTDTGLPGIGHKAYKHMGILGQLLSQRADRVKTLSYVDKYLELTTHRTTIHPSFRTPGTITGRLSSKEPNLQQLEKTKAMMSLFRARPGMVWVDLDFSALEPTVLTEFSQDENLLAIYGDSAPKNDIYLYVAASIPSYSSTIRATGYEPKNPRPEYLARAKQECKAIRSICKTVVLACQYGAGVKKVMQTLEQDDVFLDWEQVEAIHSGYWDVFAKVKDFSRSLFFEWRRNDGYILNGMGRPMCVPEDYNKDLLNRFIQSTGHDILIKYISILTRNLNAANIPWMPIIIDFHDATTVEVPEEYAEKTVQIFQQSMNELNEFLQGTVKLRGVPTVGYNLAEVKEPEE
jgi:DNA polymerase I-like protein with 3'-5' exonuclease and polymerase domains